VSRIFLSLCMAGTALVAIAFFLGLGIDDPTIKDPSVLQSISRHMLIGLGALIFASLVHAIVLTYFMGTGRWVEETSRAYKLPTDFHNESQKIKYRLMPGITACILMLVLTGACGASADPATIAWGYVQESLGMTPSTLHLTIAILTVAVNVWVSIFEFRSIERNGEIVEEVMNEVNRIRTERGLPV
jgi:hypothetical protein